VRDQAATDALPLMLRQDVGVTDQRHVARVLDAHHPAELPGRRVRDVVAVGPDDPGVGLGRRFGDGEHGVEVSFGVRADDHEGSVLEPRTLSPRRAPSATAAQRRRCPYCAQRQPGAIRLGTSNYSPLLGAVKS